MFGITDLPARLDRLDTQMTSMVDSLGTVVELLEEVSTKLTALSDSDTLE